MEAGGQRVVGMENEPFLHPCHLAPLPPAPTRPRSDSRPWLRLPGLGCPGLSADRLAAQRGKLPLLSLAPAVRVPLLAAWVTRLALVLSRGAGRGFVGGKDRRVETSPVNAEGCGLMAARVFLPAPPPPSPRWSVRSFPESAGTQRASSHARWLSGFDGFCL